jgi:predicted transcriptional regulator
VLTPDAIRSDLWGFFHAAHIATNIEGAVTVEQGELGAAALKRLSEQRFDQAPVLFQDRVVGWIAASRLSEK